MSISDVMVHVNESLNSETRHALEEEIREMEGVICPRFSSKEDHLLEIAYNPDVIGAIDLLHKVESHGYHAQLVGM